MTEPEAKPEAAVIRALEDEAKNIRSEGRSTQDVLLIIAAIGVVVANVIGVAGGIYLNAKIEVAKTEATRVAVDSDKKLDVIHEQTNSNLTGVNERLEKAYNKIEVLEELLIEEKKPKETDPVEETDP